MQAEGQQVNGKNPPPRCMGPFLSARPCPTGGCYQGRRICGNLSKAYWNSQWLFTKCTEDAPLWLGEDQQRHNRIPPRHFKSLLYPLLQLCKNWRQGIRVQRDLLRYRKLKVGLERKENSPNDPKAGGQAAEQRALMVQKDGDWGTKQK